MTRWPPPPRLSAAFYKAHGLGNDYLVFTEGEDWTASPDNVRTVCHRHRGVGSDGIVVLLGGGDVRPHGGVVRPRGGMVRPRGGDVLHARLRMFNPDGSEFERSGNGLRVLASYLLRADPMVGAAEASGREGQPSGREEEPTGREEEPSGREIDVEVGGSRIRMIGHGTSGGVYDVSVEMGRARTGPDAVGLDPEALAEDGHLPGPGGAALAAMPVSVGNPHVVIVCGNGAELTEERLAVVGPFVAGHEALEHGANVQLALPVADDRCRALIWERGVGRTSASGTSACAVAAALVSSGRMEPGTITVEMPGGDLRVSVDADLEVVLRGPVEEVAEGRLAAGFLEGLG